MKPAKPSHGTLLVNGVETHVYDAYSCGPGTKPHTFQIPGGRIYRKNKSCGPWIKNVRGAQEYEVQISYTPPPQS